VGGGRDEAPADWPGPFIRRLVELEGIEPSSVRWQPDALRPFPWLWLTDATSPGRVGTGPVRRIFLRCQQSLPAVSGLSLPSTTASGDRLQWSGPACHYWSRWLSTIWP